MTDESTEILYNNSNEYAITHDGEIVERIDIASMPTLTKPGCKHERTSRAVGDIPGHDEITCQDCPLGWYEAREVS